jgi:hypothetical protein
MTTRTQPTDFAALLQRFFVERLIQQRNASPRTVESYRDSFRLLLSFAQQTLHKPPATLALEDLNPVLISGFSIILKQHVAIPSGAETRDLPPSTPSTVLSVCSIRKH